jgi:hypothetical protein
MLTQDDHYKPAGTGGRSLLAADPIDLRQGDKV